MDWINSSDSHVLEPADLYTGALGDKYPDACPRYLDSYQGVSGTFYFTGYEYIRLDNVGGGADPERAAFREDRMRASEDPNARLECLDKDGVWGEVLNATWTLHTLRAPNDDLAKIAVQCSTTGSPSTAAPSPGVCMAPVWCIWPISIGR